eukprot:TRINITY_DN51903_c0_g1_i1.p1 TRINITY_DN51903_c0_g1~~TRINITY_DN51903_c0_g1_i1.p1  ORF type:complete len:469 (+),score=115.25 TRINITY_DN51903_c0_g1_i1:87-1409(+)
MRRLPLVRLLQCPPRPQSLCPALQRRGRAGLAASCEADWLALVQEIAARSQQPPRRVADALGRGLPSMAATVAGLAEGTPPPPPPAEPFGPIPAAAHIKTNDRALTAADHAAVTETLRQVRNAGGATEAALAGAYRRVLSLPLAAHELLQAAALKLDPTLQALPILPWWLAHLHRYGAAGQAARLDMSGSGSRCAVIIDDRALYSLPLVVRNVVWQLNLAPGAAGGWDLLVVGSQAVHDLLHRQLPSTWRWKEIAIESLWDPPPARQPTGVDVFNAAAFSPALWDRFADDTLLLFFQADTALVRPITPSFVSRAEGISFLGAACPDHFGALAPGSFCCNGGLSTRVAGAFRHALQGPDFGELGPPCHPEDLWFVRRLRQLQERGAGRKPLPTLRECAEAFVESPLWGHSLRQCVGVHATDKEYLPIPAAEAVLCDAVAPL